MSPLATALTTTTAALVVVALNMLVVPVLAPAIAADLGVSTTLAGTWMSILWLGGIFSSVFAGSLVGRHGVIRVTQGYLLVCAAGQLLGALSPSFSRGADLLLLGGMALLVGIASGLETPAGSQLLARVAPTGRRSIVFSIKQAGQPAGSFLAGLGFPTLAAIFGWRGVAICMLLLSVALAGAIQPARRAFDASRDPRPAATLASIATAMRLAVRDTALRRLSIISFTYGFTQICMNTFLVSFLVQDFRLSLVAAGSMLAAAQVGGFIGRIGWGYVADRFVRPRIVVALLGIVTSTAAIVLGLLPHGSTGLLLPLCFVFGLTASGWNGVFLAEVVRLAPAHHVGEATSGVLTICHIGLMIGPLLFAAIAAAWSFGIAYIAIACVTLASAFLMLRRYPGR